MKKMAYIHALLTLMVGFGMISGAMAKDHDTGKNRYQIIAEDRLRDEFMAYLVQSTGEDPSDMILSRFKVSRNNPVPQGIVSFQLFQKNKGALKGNVSLIAIVKVNGIAENEVKLNGWVDVFAPVVCSSRNLKKGEVIHKEDIYLARKNISRQSRNILKEPDKIIGRLAKNSIKQDTCIKEWMLERAPMLNKGDQVTILAQLGSIRITVPGIILEKGYAGERVRVQNTMSSKEIYARVMNASTVTVDF